MIDVHVILFTGKFGSSELEPIDDRPESDNNVDDGDDDLTTNASRTTTPTSVSSGYVPQFTNQNALNRLVGKPSGNMIKFRCPAKGDPEPTIEWTKDGKPIERKMGQVQYSKWAMTMEDLIPADHGEYTCKICNIHGCISFSSKLEVSGNFEFFYSLNNKKSKILYKKSHNKNICQL